MPTYVYRRPDGTLFETFQKISDPALTTDPETGVPVERVISGGAGLQFKGSGFYLTDYGRAGQTKEPSSGKKDAETPAPPKPDAAPAAKESGTKTTPAATSDPK